MAAVLKKRDENIQIHKRLTTGKEVGPGSYEAIPSFVKSSTKSFNLMNNGTFKKLEANNIFNQGNHKNRVQIIHKKLIKNRELVSHIFKKESNL